MCLRNSLLMLREGVRMHRFHRMIEREGYARRGEEAAAICEDILERSWNGTILKTGRGNYPQFWSRDFGMVLPSLLDLGHREQAAKTLSYALDRYAAAGRVTTQLTPLGKAMNFPSVYSPDSFAYLLRSVRLIGDRKLFAKHKAFLQQETDRFCEEALEKDGKVKRHIHLGGMRDHAVRDASCYDTVMAAVVQREAKTLGLSFAFPELDYRKILLEEYWTGKHFKDDLSHDTLTADANIYPFWHGIITDKRILKQAVASMQAIYLDKPFPIKYVASKRDEGKTIWQNLFVKDWETDSVWPMSGLPYIDILTSVDKKKAMFHHEQYRELIEKHGTFIEVYCRNGHPYKSWFYSADQDMIWCAIWLSQEKKLEKK